jgi:hypothetical protein
MQLPRPSHVVPPLSLQGVPTSASAVPHVLFAHVFVRHFVAGAGQSLALLHSTQAPAASQTIPLPPQEVPSDAFDVPHVPFVQVFSRQALVCAGQSLAALHFTHVPEALQRFPP